MHMCASQHTLELRTDVFLTLLWSLANEVHFFGAWSRTREKEAWCEEPWAIREGNPSPPEESAVVDTDTQHQSKDREPHSTAGWCEWLLTCHRRRAAAASSALPSRPQCTAGESSFSAGSSWLQCRVQSKGGVWSKNKKHQPRINTNE